MTPERSGAREDALRRVRGEFMEMPGMRLTESQARRLWNLDQSICESLLSTLVETKFLFRTRDGAFMKMEQGAPLRAMPRPVKSSAA